MTPEGWALLWIGGINVVWASIFCGVLLFALRTDTEAGDDRGGPGRGPGPQPPRLPEPRGAGHESRLRPRLRGAELAAARRQRRRSGGTYHPRVHRW